MVLGYGITCVQGYDGGVIAVSEVHELLQKSHDILSNAVSKQIGNTTCILAYLFNSASRQYCEIWAFQFVFLHSMNDSVPVSETCLYGDMHWSVTQGLHQSSLESWTIPVFNLYGGC